MKMKILLLMGICVCNFLQAQVGVNITNPQGVFHIDPLGDTVGANNGSDDIIVLNNGNVGVGTLSPSTKLHIKSSTAGAIRIEDGTEGLGRVLTSDAQGVGRWEVAKGSLVNGVVFAENIPAPSTWSLTKSYIIIPPQVSCVIACMAQFSLANISQSGLFLGFSTSNTAFLNASPAAQVIFNRQYSMAGSFLICNGFVTDIKNTSNSNMTLYLWARSDQPVGTVRYAPANTVNDIKLYAIVN